MPRKRERCRLTYNRPPFRHGSFPVAVTTAVPAAARLLVMVALALVPQSVLAAMKGERVVAVLERLKGDGLTFIYNTQLVPDSLVIEREPRADAGVALAREVLAQHSLTLSPIAPNVYAVVAQSTQDRATRLAPPSTVTTQTQSALEEVVVQTSRYTLASPALGSHAFLTQEQVKSLPRLADETLRALERLPGAAGNGMSALASIRGGEPNETAIVLDGLRLYEPFHLKNFLSPVSLLDSRLIDTIDVYSGGYPAIYGDRMSAIVDARSVHPASPRYYELGLSVFHASGLASFAYDDERGHVLVSARRSNADLLAQLSESDFGKPEYLDGFARTDYAWNTATRASLSALFSRDSITALESEGRERARAKYENVYLWTTLEHDWSDTFSSRAIVSLTEVENERTGQIADPGRRTGRVSDVRRFDVFGLRLDSTLLTGALTQRFGIDIRRLTANYEYSSFVHYDADFPFPGSPPFDETRVFGPRPDGFEGGAFWDARFRLNEHFTAQAGLRLDTQTYDGTGDAEQWSPRVSLLYDLSDDTHLRASWGRFYQSQGINELQVEDGVDRFSPVQHADHFIVSVEHALEAGIDVRVEAYRKRYRDLRPRFENLLDPLVLLPELEFDRVAIDPEGARVDGFELLFTLRQHGPWSGWLGYAWSRARDRIEGRDVARSWDQRHALNLGIVWTSGPWAVTVADTSHTGWPTTRLTLVPQAANAPPLVVAEPRNSSRLNDYNSLDFRVTRTFDLAHGVLDVWVEASNLASRRNECCRQYDVTRSASGQYELVTDTDHWLPLVPSAGVLWRY
jgi:outer membrane receptor protein involved in Fe transport